MFGVFSAKEFLAAAAAAFMTALSDAFVKAPWP